MTDLEWLCETAEKCRHIADIANNQEIRRLLDELAHKIEGKAAELARRGGFDASDAAG